MVTFSIMAYTLMKLFKKTRYPGENRSQGIPADVAKIMLDDEKV